VRLSRAAHHHYLEDGSWHINHVNYGNANLVSNIEDEQYISDEMLGEMVLSKIKPCKKCYNCKTVNAIMVLGKQFDDVCQNWLMMKSPDIATLNCAKKIVLMRKRAIANIGRLADES